MDRDLMTPGGRESEAAARAGTRGPRGAARAAIAGLTGAALLGVGAVVLLAEPREAHRDAPAAATAPTPVESAPPAEVWPAHAALHDIDARCKPGADVRDRARLDLDAAAVLAFAGRHPAASFAIDDESGTTLSLLLVTRQALKRCDAPAATRVNQVLPARFRWTG